MTFKRALLRLYEKHFNLLHLCVILLVSIAVFWRIYSLSFLIGWDDQTYVTNHYTEDGLFLQNICAILTEFYHGQYAPINQLYYSTLFEFFDYNTAVYHVGSLILHLTNAVLVYFLICRIAKALFVHSSIQSAQIACITALLFAVAPVNLEPVAWVAAAKVLWYALFYFSSLLCYIKYVSEGKSLYYYFVLLLFVLSFGSKEQAVTLPLAMLTIDYIFKRNFRDALVWYEKLPLIALTMTFALASFQSQGGGKVVITNYYNIWERSLLAFYTTTEYFTKTVLPINLSFAYPYPFQIGQTPPFWLWFYLIGIPAIIYCFWRILSKPWVLWGLSFFLVHIVLVSNVINLSRYSAIADRYAYVATVGIFFLLAVCFIIAFNIRKMQHLFFTTGFIYMLYFAIYTTRHLPVWTNSITLKQQMRDVIRSRADYNSWESQKIKNKDEKH